MDYSQEEIDQIINSVELPNISTTDDVENILDESIFLIELFNENHKCEQQKSRLLLNLIKLYNTKYIQWKAVYNNHKEKIKYNQAIPFDFENCKYQLSELEKMIMNNF
jgi:hypothetical protein